MRHSQPRAKRAGRRAPPAVAFAAAAALAATLSASSAAADEPAGRLGAPRPSTFSLDAFVWSTSPVALDSGLPLGGGLSLLRRVGDRGLFLGARVGLAESSLSTAVWNLTHVHALGALCSGAERRAGKGLFRVQVELGAMVVRQLGERQQIQRLSNAGLSDLKRGGWSSGPFAAAEIGAGVYFLDSWRAFVSLGPGVTVQKVAGARATRWLLTSALGVGRDF